MGEWYAFESTVGGGVALVEKAIVPGETIDLGKPLASELRYVGTGGLCTAAGELHSGAR